MSEVVRAPSSVLRATEDLPPVPPASADLYLDAAARCFARHGITRTSVPDVAAELGVSRTTVYRQVGSIDQIARLLLARDLHRLLLTLPARDGLSGPDWVVAMLERVVRFAWDHPVMDKVLRDEPELLGPFMTRELSSLLARVSSVVLPILSDAMAAGLVAERDPEVVTEHLVRTVISLVLAPPARDLHEVLALTLGPLLEVRA